MVSLSNRRPLRIIHSEAATGFGGQERDIFIQMVAMREHGHHLEAICQPEAELASRLRKEDFMVHTLSMDGSWNYCRGVGYLNRLLRRSSIDVVNTHSRRDTMLVGLAARLAKVPLIVRSRHLARRPNSLISYTGIPHRIITCSEAVRQQLLARRVPSGHVTTVYSAVEKPAVRQAGKLRAELGLSDQAVIVGSVGVLRRAKGHVDLLAAMKPLLNKRSDLHLVIVGDGNPVYGQLQQEATQSQLSSQVHLLGRRDDVVDLLAGFDIFALATREEALGRVFIEAAAAGLPVVATDVGGVAETLVAGETGFLVPLDDTLALATAIQQLVDNPALRKKMGQAGQAFYQNADRFTTHAMVKGTEKCYRRWLAELST